MICELHIHLDFKQGLYSPKPSKIIVLIMVTGKTSIKRVDGKETTLFELLELPISHIR